MSLVSRRAFLCLILAMIGWTAGVSAAEPEKRLARTPSEYEVKAAYLYYFAKFIEWPESIQPAGESPVIIGIMGEDPFGLILEEVMNGKKVQNRRIQIRRLETSEDFHPCHILFLGSIDSGRFSGILEKLQESHVLTVCESGFKARKACMINFVLEGDKVQFDVNAGKADEAGLKISSKLMMVARKVLNDSARGKD